MDATLLDKEVSVDLNQSASNKAALPGDLAMWFFILAELTVFAIFFFAFAVTRQLHPQMFLDGQATLHPIAGVINTLALITSSYLVALGVAKVHQGQQPAAARFLLFALLVAAIYIVTKLWEYQVLWDGGYGISTNTFYTLYFFITFFHFMHVLLGMIILAFIAIKAKDLGYAESTNGFVSGAVYWHMVDLVWIILFPLIYIIQ